MNSEDKYKLAGFVHPVGSGLSFLTPFFVRHDRFWIQEIDDTDRIIGFKRMVLAGYIFPDHRGIEILLGSPALFAFYPGGNAVLTGVRQKLTTDLVQWSEYGRTSPSVARSIAEFVGQADLIGKLTQARSTPPTLKTMSPNYAGLSALAELLPALLDTQLKLFEVNRRSATEIAEISAAASAELVSGLSALAKPQGTPAELLSIVTSAANHTPRAAEDAVALVKSAVAAANNAFESVQKAARQATELAEANFLAMSNTAVKLTKETRSRKKVVGE